MNKRLTRCALLWENVTRRFLKADGRVYVSCAVEASTVSVWAPVQAR